MLLLMLLLLLLLLLSLLMLLCCFWHVHFVYCYTYSSDIGSQPRTEKRWLPRSAPQHLLCLVFLLGPRQLHPLCL